MSATQRTWRTFVAVTMVTVIAVTAVFVAYAVVLSTLYGGNVSVSSAQGLIWYNEMNSTSAAAWTSTLGPGNGTAWYAKLNITSAGYSGLVTITWTLEKQDGSWTPVAGATQTTSTTLSGAIGQTIYASSGGSQATNKNWGAYSTSAGTYRVKAVIAK